MLFTGHKTKAGVKKYMDASNIKCIVKLLFWQYNVAWLWFQKKFNDRLYGSTILHDYIIMTHSGCQMYE